MVLNPAILAAPANVSGVRLKSPPPLLEAEGVSKRFGSALKL